MNAQDMLRAVGAYGLVGTFHDLPEEPLEPRLWRSLLNDVVRQRMTGLLVAAIDDGALPATAEQEDQASGAHLRWLTHVLRLEHMLVQVIETLRAAGIDLRVLKGSTAAHLDYADPSLRVFVDVDLLVRGEDIDRTVALLTEGGGRRRSPEPRPGFDRRFTKSVCVVTADGLELDIHRTLAGGSFGQRILVEDLWAGEPDGFVLAGREVAAPGRELRLLHASYHAVLGDVPPRLVPLRDVAQLALDHRIDTAAVQAAAIRWGGCAVVARALRTAWATYRVADVTALSAWAACYVPTDRERRELAALTSAARSYASQAYGAARAVPGLGNRVRYVWALAAPRRDYLEGRHPSARERLRGGLSAARRVRAVEPLAEEEWRNP